MDRKSRVENAIRQKPIDRIPVGFWFHFAGEEREGEPCVQAHLRHFRESNTDFLKVMSDSFFEYPISYDVQSASEWRKVRPLGKDHPYIRKQVERVKRVCEETHGECCVFYNVFAPFSLIRFAKGDEMVMAHLKENEEGILAALEAISEDNFSLCRALFEETGCSGIYYAVQGGEKYRFTVPEYRRLISPSDRVVLDYANRYSDLNMIHMCAWAGDANNLEVWQDYPAAVFNWAVYIEGLSLQEGIRFFGGKTVMGGFDNRKTGVLYSGSLEEISGFTRGLAGEVGLKTPGIIFGADCTLSNDIDRSHIRAVGDTLDAMTAAQ